MLLFGIFDGFFELILIIWELFQFGTIEFLYPLLPKMDL